MSRAFLRYHHHWASSSRARRRLSFVFQTARSHHPQYPLHLNLQSPPALPVSHRGESLRFVLSRRLLIQIPRTRSSLFSAPISSDFRSLPIVNRPRRRHLSYSLLLARSEWPSSRYSFQNLQKTIPSIRPLSLRRTKKLRRSRFHPLPLLHPSLFLLPSSSPLSRFS